VQPFDPRSTQPRDFEKPSTERRPGGLGVHLVKELVDEFQYDYRDGRSTITVAKRLG
jgi:serine/threonine-protein kinase RsbW